MFKSKSELKQTASERDEHPGDTARRFNRLFLSKLLHIVAVVGMAEFLVMLLLDALHRGGVTLSRPAEALLDAGLLALLCAPSIWYLSLRTLSRQLLDEQQRVCHETQKNRELRRALDIYALVSVIDPQGHIIYANGNFCRASGYTQEELAGRPYCSVNSCAAALGYTPEERGGRQYGGADADDAEAAWRSIAHAGIWRDELRNQNKQGGYYWVDAEVVPLFDEHGKLCEYISIGRDITEIKRTAEALKRLELATQACADMIMITDADGVIEYVNPAFSRFTGWASTEAIGKTPAILKSGKTPPSVYGEMMERLNSGRPWSGRLLNRRRGRPSFQAIGQTTLGNSRLYWAEASITPILDAGGVRSGFVSVQRDITDIVAREEQFTLEREDTAVRLDTARILQQHIPLRERLVAVLDALFNLSGVSTERKGSVLVYTAATDTLEPFVSRGDFGEELTGQQGIFVDERRCRQVIHSGKLLISDDCYCRTGHSDLSEAIQKHGHYILPIRTGDTLFGVILLYTDPYPLHQPVRVELLKQVGEMTGLAFLQEQTWQTLTLARDEAMEATRVKSEFLANMSHEIRTPMNGILGMLDMLLCAPLTPVQRDFAETAHASANSLLDIINSILDFSKIEAGKLKLETVNFDLRDLTEQVCALFGEHARAKGLELTCFIPSAVPTLLRGDPVRLRQILANLINNALKFTERGEVSIYIDCSERAGNRVSLRCTVKDSGVGIASEIQSKLFQPFVQADGSTTRRYGGTGLGLSICRQLVDLMGGEMGVESSPGQGSTFWFTIALTVQEACTRSSGPQLPRDLGGLRVLTVDDNATNRKILWHYFDEWGMHVSLAESAPQALGMLHAANEQKQPFNLIVTDMQMPEMDGLMLCGEIEKDPVLKVIPRILLSSIGAIEDSALAKYGVARSLTKPVKRAQLLEAVMHSIGTASSAHSRTANAAVAARFPGSTALVVEDDAINRKVAMAMLSRCGLAVTLAANGRLALHEVMRSKYDLVFMDCHMPEMDGYTAARAIRDHERSLALPRTPVIAMTANALAGDREKCFAAGMDDYLSKPFTITGITQMLARWLTATAAAPESREPATPALSLPIAAADVREAVWSRAEALSKLDGDAALLDSMIEMFVDYAPDLVARLYAAVETSNREAIADAAHALKGAVAHFCAGRARELASRLEFEARSGAIVDPGSLAASIDGEVHRLVQALQTDAVSGTTTAA
jgi:PAS domain S-box-containing protein